MILFFLILIFQYFFSIFIVFESISNLLFYHNQSSISHISLIISVYLHSKTYLFILLMMISYYLSLNFNSLNLISLSSFYVFVVIITYIFHSPSLVIIYKTVIYFMIFFVNLKGNSQYLIVCPYAIYILYFYHEGFFIFIIYSF